MSENQAPQTPEAKERLDVHASTDRLQVALHQQRFDFVLKQFTRVQSVLEIGTGLGSFSPSLASRCDEYTGIEFDAESALIASKRLKGSARILQGDARRLPFEPCSFSVIVCLEVLEHLGDWKVGIKGIHETLKQDGLAIISVPYRRRGGKSQTNPYHLYEPGKRELVSEFRRRFAYVSIYYQLFQETLVMSLARLLHARRLFGLDKIYRALAEGEPEATSQLKITPAGMGMKLHLLVVAKLPKPLFDGE